MRRSLLGRARLRLRREPPFGARLVGRGSGDRPPGDGQAPRQVVEDPADAPLVEAGAGGDLRELHPLALEAKDLAVLRRALLEHPLPELAALGDLAGAGL